MEKWLLLVLTVVAAGITADALRWREGLKKAPFSAISHLWSNGLAHLSLTDREQVREQFVSGTMNVRLIGVFVACTLFLAIATIRAFLE